MIQGKAGIGGSAARGPLDSGTLTGMSDAQLLSRFTERSGRDGRIGFRELVNRHGADGHGGLPPDPPASA